mmetsp:Transcript_4320/g.13711  ORF Transcript_4320/g.13711 Transcript_4320/m.13711 type:complete len:300 (-) Transcript_4320:314-1213(-)
MSVRRQHELGRVIQVHTDCARSQHVAETILGRVIYPFVNEDLRDRPKILGVRQPRPRKRAWWHGEVGLGRSVLLVYCRSASRALGRSRRARTGGRAGRAGGVPHRRSRVKRWVGGEAEPSHLRDVVGEAGGRVRQRHCVAEKRVRANGVQVGTHSRVFAEDGADEAFGLHGYFQVRWETVEISLDSLVGLLDILGLERGLADEHGVQDDPQRPNIDLEAVPEFAVEDLRRDVVGRPAHGLFTLVGVLEFGREAKVADADVVAVGEKYVAQFQVAVYDVLRLEVCHAVQQLQHDLLGEGL